MYYNKFVNSDNKGRMIMIYTVTFNPAIDYVLYAKDFEVGKISRSVCEKYRFGGKGINVSIVLNALQVSSTALGFVGGFTGKALEDGLKAEGINTDFVQLESGNTRINVKIRCGEETDINAAGPDVPSSAVEQLFKKLDSTKCGDVVVLAGSVPSTLPDDIYESLMNRLCGRGIRFAVDTTGQQLLNVLKYKPFVIKPNHIELGEIFGRELKTDDDIITCEKELKRQGAINVLVSRGEAGAILVDEKEKIHKIGTANGRAIDTVGAGDSMLAAFLAGCIMQKNAEIDYDYALRLGAAAGCATAFCDGLAKKEDIENIMKVL